MTLRFLGFCLAVRGIFVVLGSWCFDFKFCLFCLGFAELCFLNLVFECVFVGCYAELFVFCVVVDRFCCGVECCVGYFV